MKHEEDMPCRHILFLFLYIGSFPIIYLLLTVFRLSHLVTLASQQ